MVTEKKLQIWLGYILKFGIFISLAFVLVGAVSFLTIHGNENFNDNIFLVTNYDIDILKIWQSKEFYSPLGMIELGLLALVIVQVLRVAFLTYYYTLISDKWFMLFSFFILSVILYTLIWQ